MFEMTNEKCLMRNGKMIRSLSRQVGVLKRLRHLAWIVFSVDELFAFGRWTANRYCLGRGRIHRRASCAGKRFESHLCPSVTSQHVRKGSAHVISSQQVDTV